MKVLAWKKTVASLLKKNGIFGDPNPQWGKEKRNDLKLFENKSEIKIILKIWSFENNLKIEVLKIKFGNWDFEELFENGSLKN